MNADNQKVVGNLKQNIDRLKKEVEKANGRTKDENSKVVMMNERNKKIIDDAKFFPK